MKFAAAKTKNWLIRFICSLLVMVALLPSASAAADSYPYIKTYGADVAAGGWFGSSCGGNTNYQSSQNSAFTTNRNLYGGILTYSRSAGGLAQGGSSSQYGALALGDIVTNASTPSNGFYSGGSQAGGAVGRLSFANISGLGNYGDPNQCIPDYYSEFYPSNPANATTLDCTGLDPNPTSGVYIIDTSCATPTTGTINAFDLTQSGDVVIGQKTEITILVKGNVYIGHSIFYGPHTAAQTPKFLLIAEGNIYVGPNSGAETARELDGWYVAQPETTNATTIGSTGNFWTCYDRTDSSGKVGSDFIYNNCMNQLKVKGAVTAKQIFFERANGDIYGANTGVDGGSVNDPNDPNASEVINYTPDMVAGDGFLNPNKASGSANIQQLLSLPPAF